MFVLLGSNISSFLTTMSLPTSLTNNDTILANASATGGGDGDDGEIDVGTPKSTTTTMKAANTKNTKMNSNKPQEKAKSKPATTSGGGKMNTTSSDIHANTTLGSLLKYMEGYEIIVELKTGKRIQGILQSVDDTMTMVLLLNNASSDGDNNYNITKQQQQQQQQPQEERSIRGSNIRYIQFPDNADLYNIIQIGKDRERIALNKYKRTKRR